MRQCPLLQKHFYPRPPRGGRPRSPLYGGCALDFYPRPPRGGRPLRVYRSFTCITFLSTPSARRATCILYGHVPPVKDFYPRPPRGGRPSYSLRRSVESSFLSTPSARRATDRMPAAAVLMSISIHALREEGDGHQRPPIRTIPISIHALREEGDQRSQPAFQQAADFYPRPPRGGRQQKQRENPLLLSHYTPLCTNCKEVPVKQTAKSHRYLCKRLVFRCEASGKTMCAACSHWRGIKRSAHYPAQTPGAAQHARP